MSDAEDLIRLGEVVAEIKVAVAERDALRAENEQWKATMKTAIELGGKQLEELDALRARVAELEAERDRLRAENERLKDAIYKTGCESYEREQVLRARVAELRGLCNWAAGRFLDAGDIVGHEMLLAALAKGGE